MLGWVAEADSVEQKDLRASVVLYCYRPNPLGAAILEQFGATTGTPQAILWTIFIKGLLLPSVMASTAFFELRRNRKLIMYTYQDPTEVK